MSHLRPSAARHRRALPAVLLSAVLAAGTLPAVATVAPDSASAASASAKPKKKKKKRQGRAPSKKKDPLTATVSGTFTLRHDALYGFGNDNGANWQQLKVVVKDQKIPFKGSNRVSAAADVEVRWEYQAEAHTLDRSWHAGCDSEDRNTYGGWSGKAQVSVAETRWLQTAGKSKKFLGWQLKVAQPKDGIYVVSKGTFLDWESILMTNCQSFEINEPLGSWSTAFGDPDGVGRLNDGGRSVILNQINTAAEQTGTADGKIKFNESVER